MQGRVRLTAKGEKKGDKSWLWAGILWDGTATWQFEYWADREGAWTLKDGDAVPAGAHRFGPPASPGAGGRDHESAVGPDLAGQDHVDHFAAGQEDQGALRGRGDA